MPCYDERSTYRYNIAEIESHLSTGWVVILEKGQVRQKIQQL